MDLYFDTEAIDNKYHYLKQDDLLESLNNFLKSGLSQRCHNQLKAFMSSTFLPTYNETNERNLLKRKEFSRGFTVSDGPSDFGLLK